MKANLLRLFYLFVFLYIFFGSHLVHPSPTPTPEDHPVVVYVFTIHSEVCQKKSEKSDNIYTAFPNYIRSTLQQALFSQANATIYFGSNFGECPRLHSLVQDLSPRLIAVDINQILSSDTLRFRKGAKAKMDNQLNGLYIESAARFFYLADIMAAYNLTAVLHLEADNLLYTPLSMIWKDLLQHYHHLSAVSLTRCNRLLIASAFWVRSPPALRHFTKFLLDLVEVSQEWSTFMHYWAKRKIVSEMLMLGYYHNYFKDRLLLFPVLPPDFDYEIDDRCDLREWRAGGKYVGPATGSSLWDGSSYGQFLGGTPNEEGTGFLSMTHIQGGALLRNKNCTLHIRCASEAISSQFDWKSLPQTSDSIIATTTTSTTSAGMTCATAPFLRCHESRDWSIIANLHIHSKKTQSFVSRPCACS